MDDKSCSLLFSCLLTKVVALSGRQVVTRFCAWNDYTLLISLCAILWTKGGSLVGEQIASGSATTQNEGPLCQVSRGNSHNHVHRCSWGSLLITLPPRLASANDYIPACPLVFSHSPARVPNGYKRLRYSLKRETCARFNYQGTPTVSETGGVVDGTDRGTPPGFRMERP